MKSGAVLATGTGVLISGGSVGSGSAAWVGVSSATAVGVEVAGIGVSDTSLEVEPVDDWTAGTVVASMPSIGS